jgi:hypothetical protein
MGGGAAGPGRRPLRAIITSRPDACRITRVVRDADRRLLKGMVSARCQIR